MYRRILIGMDGSANADSAFALASDLAIKYEAELLVVHVMPPLRTDRQPKQVSFYSDVENLRPNEALWALGEEIVRNAKRKAQGLGVQDVRTILALGNPAHEILECGARHGVDLIIVGRRGLGKIKKLLVGSVSHKVSQLAECPCLTVP